MEPRNFYDPIYKAWRKKVYARDRFTCQMPNCPRSCRQLNAHHIKRFADCPELRLEVSNGITLCKVCHDSVKDRESQYEAVFMNIISKKGSGRGSVAVSILLTKYRRKQSLPPK